MVLFDFKSDKHFVASSDRTTLKVYELTNPTLNPSSIRKNHWKEVADITPLDHDESENDDEDEGDGDGASAEEESFDGLMFFDGHGKIEGREALTKLAQHLTRLQLKVSPEGHCFHDVTGLGEHRDFGFHYLRLNDLFNWSYHGVKMAGISTMWRRLVLEYTVPKGEKRSMNTGGVSKERYEELKRMIGKKDEELGKLREEMEEQDWEMEKLKDERGKRETELRELEKKNGKELRKLLKKKDGEFQTLRREKDGELEDKSDELEMLRKEKDDEAKLSKGKDDELRKLREEVKNLRRDTKGDEAASAGGKGKVLVDSDEWHKLKKDEAEMRQEVTKKDEEMKRRLEKEKIDNEALQKLVNEKDAESHRLRKEKEEMMEEKAPEMEKLRKQLLQVRLELEQRRKQSWVTTPTTKLVALSGCNDDIISRRRPVSRYIFCVDERKLGNFNYQPYKQGSLPFLTNWKVCMVDEDPKDWPPPPKMNVYSSSGPFDQDNWWVVKTTHLSDGNLTMMAYYDGNFCCSVFPENGWPNRLPYSWDNPLTADTSFFLVHVGREYKLAFMYRD